MTKFLMLYEICELYFEEVRNQHSAQQSERIINEFRSALFRLLLPQWGFKRTSLGRKMSSIDVADATDYTKQLSVQRLLKARELLKVAFDKADVTQASRNTYGNRIEQFLQWCEQQSWWPCERLLRIQNQCRPPQRISGRRHYSDLPLTSRNGPYLRYRLTDAETPPALQAQIEGLDHYLVAPRYPGRVFDPVKPSTRDTYMKDVRLMLGFFCRHKQEPVPLEQLRLEDVVPLVSEDDLEGLSYQQQQKLWKEKQLYLETWLCQYFEFIRDRNNSTSPRTQLAKLVALQRIGHYLYRHQISQKGDYRSIPVLITLETEISKVVALKKKWERTKTYVANQERKWPDAVEGETALTTIRREIVEPLRLECRPRRKDGVFRDGDVIAISHQHYLKWTLVTDAPPRRQRAYRTTKIALSCPVDRPSDVPADGCYFPLPPSEEREKNYDGTLADNYLYRTYSYRGKVYCQGIWILELTSFKTDETYGVYSMILPDRQFEDGTAFYDHLDHYLCGWWMPEGKKNLQAYDWWDSQLRGRRGRWVTKGRAEFEPQDVCEAPNRRQSPIWRSGYLFPVPKTGLPANGTSFGGSFERTSYQILGKRITPHMLRSVWATWAFQVGLSDQELHSLAYAMGHSVETLRKMYERCTPEEKLRPIYEAIDRHLFQQLEASPETAIAKPNLLKLAENLSQLSSEELQDVLKLVEQA
ncbi:site-specific integrase [Leptolyngbya sp. FACHB-671]|uniref:site-specific integrase n=1 Tax=Leptolyngbya sp. FACHB-671 TaxID=2692812 RepID=UPI001688C51A|nr:site-specific integrase [Leptolyngbya sp. FACHB-671]MBD2066222.1 site-specific integrase [Leptolyngbya sp. FACHB-671]